MMKTMRGEKMMTISAESGETYAVRYETAQAVDIFNGTAGDILIAESSDFTSEDGKGAYIRLPPKAGFNGLRTKIMTETLIYIKALAAGSVSLATP